MVVIGHVHCRGSSAQSSTAVHIVHIRVCWRVCMPVRMCTISWMRSASVCEGEARVVPVAAPSTRKCCWRRSAVAAGLYALIWSCCCRQVHAMPSFYSLVCHASRFGVPVPDAVLCIFTQMSNLQMVRIMQMNDTMFAQAQVHEGHGYANTCSLQSWLV